MHKHKYPHTDAEIAENKWLEISEESAMDMLGCVPPLKQLSGGFAVGEPLCHTADGRIVVSCCIRVGEKWYEKPNTITDFNNINFPNLVAQVEAQLAQSK